MISFWPWTSHLRSQIIGLFICKIAYSVLFFYLFFLRQRSIKSFVRNCSFIQKDRVFFPFLLAWFVTNLCIITSLWLNFTFVSFFFFFFQVLVYCLVFVPFLCLVNSVKVNYLKVNKWQTSWYLILKILGINLTRTYSSKKCNTISQF